MSGIHLSLNSADRRPIYLQIMDEIRRAIVTGALKPNDPLPSLRDLAVDLRINHHTIAQAYRELEREGVVYVRRGQGTFVAEVRTGTAERRALIRRVARLTMLEAHRNGITAEELIEALQEIGDARPAAGGGRR